MFMCVCSFAKWVFCCLVHKKQLISNINVTFIIKLVLCMSWQKEYETRFCIIIFVVCRFFRLVYRFILKLLIRCLPLSVRCPPLSQDMFYFDIQLFIVLLWNHWLLSRFRCPHAFRWFPAHPNVPNPVFCPSLVYLCQFDCFASALFSISVSFVT